MSKQISNTDNNKTKNSKDFNSPKPTLVNIPDKLKTNSQTKQDTKKTDNKTPPITLKKRTLATN